MDSRRVICPECLDYLSTAAPEFDEKASLKYAVDLCTDETGAISAWQRDACVDGARWMYRQDAARIALAESRAESFRANFIIQETTLASTSACFEDATAKLQVAVKALEKIAGARCAWQLSQSITKEALRKINS